MLKSDAKMHKSVSYAKWGYIFIAPFFIAFIIFQLIPLISTIYNSLFTSYRIGLEQVTEFAGLDNYIQLISDGEFAQSALNTLIIWIMGFIPQILVSMLLAVWFTSYRLKLKGQRFFKTVIYMPNLIMASAFAMLFFVLFSPMGPINQMLTQSGAINESILFFDIPISNRAIIAFMNFLMWFGNTTILLMAGIMGIDQGLFESAQIDGAKPLQVFFKITLPLLMPILVYVMITSMIGGAQMFDVPQIISKGLGSPNRTCMTMIMYLNRHLQSKNVGVGGAISVLIFIITAVLSVFVYRPLMKNYRTEKVKLGKKYDGSPVGKDTKSGEVQA